MAFEAAADPPVGADFHADPPEETLEHSKGACHTEVAGGAGVADVHDPRASHERDVNTGGRIRQLPGRAATAGGGGRGVCVSGQ